MADNQIIYPPYVLKRMIERGIGTADVQTALREGEMIEYYSEEEPPRYLMLGWRNNRPIHVIAEDDPLTKETTVVTTYIPDARRWKDDFTKRRR